LCGIIIKKTFSAALVERSADVEGGALVEGSADVAGGALVEGSADVAGGALVLSEKYSI
jgi:hypothetical protein